LSIWNRFAHAGRSSRRRPSLPSRGTRAGIACRPPV